MTTSVPIATPSRSATTIRRVDLPVSGEHTTDVRGRVPGLDAVAICAYPAGAGRLELTVRYPAPGVCVVTVEGELDLLTAPRLFSWVRTQLDAFSRAGGAAAVGPGYLVLDLEPVSFLGCAGLSALLQIRDFAGARTRVHLAGLITRVVARVLEIAELHQLFDTYPTLAHALAALDRDGGGATMTTLPSGMPPIGGDGGDGG